MVNGFPVTRIGKPFEKPSRIVYSQVPLFRSAPCAEDHWMGGANSTACTLKQNSRSAGAMEYWSIVKENTVCGVLRFYPYSNTPLLHYSKSRLT
jgi:hypothetical protein